MDCQDFSGDWIEELRGDLSPERSAALREHLGRCASCRHEAAELAEMWGLLDGMEAQAGPAVRERFFEMLASHEPAAATPWARRAVFHAGLAAAMLLLGLWLGTSFGKSGNTEVRELRAEVRSMTEAVTISLLEHQSASERLRAVELAQRTRLDDPVTAALLEAVNHDPSVNVRLAALDVLAGILPRADVQRGLVDSLPRQRSPLMQVALAGVLTERPDPAALHAIEGVLEAEGLDAEVREYLQRLLSDSPERPRT
jgi:hypothetical protein